jgi:hypothetical protein
LQARARGCGNTYDVEQFLRDFKTKMSLWDVIFRDDRGKNLDTLTMLDLRSADRKKILEKLKAEDYSHGPLEEKLYGGSDMWVFGILIKRKEVYIKISMGKPGLAVICISFHIAGKPLNYPFKR